MERGGAEAFGGSCASGSIRVAGFRIDVAHSIVKDLSSYARHASRCHDILRRWRKLADGYEPRRILLGETHVSEVEP